MIEKDKISVLIEAIKDNQNIIGRMDTKARFYLAIYLALIAGLGKIILFVLEKFNFSKIHFKIKLILFGIILILIALISFYIFLIVETIRKVTSPQIHPTENILNISQRYNIFFPITDENLKIDFKLYKKLLSEMQSYEDIQNVLLLELLIVSVIRDTKVKNMKKIEKLLIISLYFVIFIIFLLILSRIFIFDKIF